VTQGTLDWRPDLLEGFECRDVAVSAAPLAGESQGALSATLVRRTLDADPERDLRTRAVLFVHGWNDYFFHTHVAAFFEAQGFTLYALDLRRCGRSYRDGQLRDYVDALDEYFEELDAARAVMAERHGSVSVFAHSTGGLTACLWASARPGAVDALMLNSPWLDLQGPVGLSAVLAPILAGLSRRNPQQVIPLPDNGGAYAHALHADFGGEWEWDRALKASQGCPVRVGWLRAILRGQASVARGLGIQIPVLVARSARSFSAVRPSVRAKTADIVLDVEKIAAQAPGLGRLVTVLTVTDGVHDLTLSQGPVRAGLFDDLARWLGSYVPSR
jgi:alpha-beta hydrolase superfamily lysophospholipase